MRFVLRRVGPTLVLPRAVINLYATNQKVFHISDRSMTWLLQCCSQQERVYYCVLLISPIEKLTPD